MADRGVSEAIERLYEPPVPGHLLYVWNHFWALWEIVGQDMTMHDIVLYRKVMAPSMSSSDIAQLIHMRNKAGGQIQKLKDEEE